MAPGILSDLEIARLVDELNNPALHRSRAGIRHVMHIPACAAIASDPSLLEIAAEIVGAAASPYRATLFDKSPDSNWLVAWHQDTALPLKKRDDRPGWGPWSVKEGINYAHAPAKALGKVVALRLHLDDSTAENGPLRVLPGTHKRGVLSDDAIHDLASAMAPVDCPVRRGGVLAMRPLLVHASSKSQSHKPRRVLHIEYMKAEAVKAFALAIA
jgi:ectoine hydroxylase-related dioxygenase (phytanoyl-CoA dioxygenase family)